MNVATFLFFHVSSKLVNQSFYLFGSNKNRHLVCRNVFVDQTMHMFLKKFQTSLIFYKSLHLHLNSSIRSKFKGVQIRLINIFVAVFD